MNISEMLRYAANNVLWDGSGFDKNTDSPWNSQIKNSQEQNKQIFTCDCFNGFISQFSEEENESVLKFLHSLGLHPITFNGFTEFEPGPERQSVRYAWLMFAADVAEEEGL